MPPPNKVLITGATGMLAQRITKALTAGGTTVVALSRSLSQLQGFSASYRWNPAAGEMDPAALEGVDAIIHLAGAGIADKRWTTSRKKEIIESRVTGTRLLAQRLKEVPNNVRTVVSASATGYYGDCGQSLKTESHEAGKGFLAETCIEWEKALHEMDAPSRRNLILRIGFVIDRHDGALPVMARPVRLFAGAPYGNGDQFLSWIDSTDLVRLFRFALENPQLTGTYNAVAPTPATNRDFIRLMGKVLHRPIWPMGIPSPIFRILLGQQSELILDSQYVSAQKITDAGFRFDFPDLEPSLRHHLLPT